jgi:2-polyprenyl-3-methyl-5-hydroxy-6-metoxy-1,4-benzoquinol methylase
MVQAACGTSTGSIVSLDGGHLLPTPWGWATIDADTLEDLATYTGFGSSDCLERLRQYDYAQLGAEWRAAAPKSAEEMRACYGRTDSYVWALTLWHATSAYDGYRAMIDQLPDGEGRTRRALDYGSGVGTTAIKLAERGYDLTIADVPGITFDYAQHRLRRRGIPFSAVAISSDFPTLGPAYDALVCFDVLEHVLNPDQLFTHLANHLASDGLIALVAPFEAQSEDEPFHLRESYLRWGMGRWSLFMSGSGFTKTGALYRRDTRAHRWARAAQYRFWRLTGLDIRYRPPVMRERTT